MIIRPLGMMHYLYYLSLNRSGSGFGDIVLDDLNCVGNETSLLSCQHAGLGINDCQHEEDAGTYSYKYKKALEHVYNIILQKNALVA